MTLQDAIEEVKALYSNDGPFEIWEVTDGFEGSASEAIATILNAVVKGELK